MASWIGAARTLVELKDQWQGTLMFIAQPAEERCAGAKAMLADGLFTRFPKPDIAFAMHTSPTPAGKIGFNVGAITSNSDATGDHLQGARRPRLGARTRRSIRS